MDNLGDYIYLALIIIAAVSSIFKNKNKQNTAKPKPKSIESEDLGEVLREIFGQKTQKKPEVVIPKDIPAQKKTAKPVQITTYENTTDIASLKAKKEVTKTVASMAPTHVIHDIEEVSEFAIKNADEARAAFISAEIFNRKF